MSDTQIDMDSTAVIVPMHLNILRNVALVLLLNLTDRGVRSTLMVWKHKVFEVKSWGVRIRKTEILHTQQEKHEQSIVLSTKNCSKLASHSLVVVDIGSVHLGSWFLVCKASTIRSPGVGCGVLRRKNPKTLQLRKLLLLLFVLNDCLDSNRLAPRSSAQLAALSGSRASASAVLRSRC